MTTDGVPASPGWPTRLDTLVAHSARVYDYWLGGKDNFGPDRDLAAQIEAVMPQVADMARANRAFTHRATEYLTREVGIRQFLDIGTGIPTRPNLHEVAQQIAPESRVVYVDNDPLVLVHARALLTSTAEGRCAYLAADLRKPGDILRSPELRDTLDLNQKIAVFFGSILMLLTGADDPWAKVRTLMQAMPAGSYLVISHPTADFDPDAMAQVAQTATTGGIAFTPRNRDEVARFFVGYQLVEPGLVPVLAWRPAGGPPDNPQAVHYWTAVAHT